MKKVEASLSKFDVLVGLIIGLILGFLIGFAVGTRGSAPITDKNAGVVVESSTHEVFASAEVSKAQSTPAPSSKPVEAPAETSSSMSTDLPAGLTDSDFNYCTAFIPGEGTFTIVDNYLVKYVNGECINLAGGALSWAGIDLNKYMPYENELHYNEDSDTLFLMTVTTPNDKDKILARVQEENDVLTPAEKELVDGVGVYLYVIPDYNVSEMQFIGQITGYIDSGSFFYRDTNNVFWKYEEQNGNYSFVKIDKMYGPIQFADEHEIFRSLNPCFVFSPFYGYYYCCGKHCYAETCKNCCDCINCN